MTRPTDQFTDVQTHSTRYWCVGSQGSPLVLIHGIGCSVLEWEHCIQALAHEHRVYALDLLGCGLSAKPADAPYDVRGLAEFVLAFMDRMEIASAGLIGNSLGARVALECAALAPQRVSALVLSAPAGIAPSTLLEFRLSSLPLLGPLLTWPHALGTAMLWKKAFVNKANVTRTLVREKLALARLPGAGAAFLKTLRGLLNVSGFRNNITEGTQARLQQIRTPALFVWGRQDRFVPISHLALAQQLMPSAQTAVIENCGHVPMIENPAAFNHLARGFLQKSHSGNDVTV